MQNLFEYQENATIHETIEEHVAWKEKISGLKADKMLRGKKTPFLYILRAGETESENQRDYYVSFVAPDFTVKHTPFVITISGDTWSYENWTFGGPYSQEQTIDEVVHLIMHCPKGAPKPFIS